jgi:hypothetical protein
MAYPAAPDWNSGAPRAAWYKLIDGDRVRLCELTGDRFGRDLATRLRGMYGSSSPFQIDPYPSANTLDVVRWVADGLGHNDIKNEIATTWFGPENVAPFGVSSRILAYLLWLTYHTHGGYVRADRGSIRGTPVSGVSRGAVQVLGDGLPSTRFAPPSGLAAAVCRELTPAGVTTGPEVASTVGRGGNALAVLGDVGTGGVGGVSNPGAARPRTGISALILGQPTDTPAQRNTRVAFAVVVAGVALIGGAYYLAQR